MSHTPEKLWEKTLAEIELEISKPNYNTWFKKTFAVGIDGDTFYIGVPSAFNKEWLQTRFNDMILSILRKHEPSITKLEYVVKKKKHTLEKREKSVAKKHIETLPLEKSDVDKETNLNKRYTFDSFIVGSFNEVAYSAAQAIIKKPGVYNPLFVYGSTGLGKTHLIQATGNELLVKNPNLKVFYTNSEKFSQDYVNALTNNRIQQFKNRYRSYDVLIMDDIQFFSGKEKLQEELFHLFNILYDKNKQIIFSSDKHPNYIVGLEDRLRSRFSAGMIVDINKPDYESRAAILKKKASERNVPVNDEIIDYLATHIDGNIRELEGVINSIAIQTELKGRKLTLDEIKHIVKNSIKPKKHLAIKEIVKIIAGYYNIHPEQIYEKSRKKEIVHVRQITMYILRELFNISYPRSGKEIGGRDHTTVIHSYEKVKEMIKEDPSLGQEIEQLQSILGV